MTELGKKLATTDRLAKLTHPRDRLAKLTEIHATLTAGGSKPQREVGRYPFLPLDLLRDW